ncbi:MAG: hypothetical protein Q9O24_01300 [Gammaproteobacteria bacterium]|nr:hypothetical protein [Gammaproteobacteria bacterium]
MCKLCWSLVLLLALLSGGLIYKFILSGSVLEASDGRAAIQLTQAEKDLVLSEMRTFLSSVQKIITAVSQDDMAAAAKAARTVGMGAQQGAPGGLMGKLPLSFKKLGFDTHRKFDQLALDAEQLGDGSHTLKQLAELTQNCVACHEMYRLDLEQQ